MDKRVVPHYEGDPASFSTVFTDEEYCSLEESESDSSAAVLGYINQMLMEEDLEENYSMFQDSLALLQAEKSFYDVLAHNYPPPPPPSIPQQSPAQSLSGSSSDSSFSSCSGTTTGSTSSCDTTASNLELDPTDYNYNNPFVPTTFPIPPNFVSQSNPTPISQSSTSYFNTTNIELGLDSNLLQFERRIEQAGTMFLPNHSPTFFPSFTNAPRVVIKTESPEEEEEVQYIGSRVCVDDSELSELFDKLLLLGTGLRKGEHVPNTSSVRRRQGNYDELVDLRTLLMLCAQAISCDNRSTANQILNQIKQHSSPTGDGTQRLAHFFGNALEARLAGTGSQIQRVLSSKRNSAKDMIRAYQVYSSACPFEKLAIIFANNAIWKNLAKKEMETLHIIDFGVGYGFKWPAFIHRLSKRPGGPPKLRITGTEHPYPVQRVHETGRRLASYCDRFNVPFEFNAIASQRWENIRVEDLKIKKNEFVAVNCLFRFENLLDETVVLENPRDAVLDLIKRAKPDIFVHGIVNGCYDAPFFVTRFREALLHYSALFDMLDTANTNVAAREDPMRLMFEEEIWGREVMNVVACEGCERVQRPETYRQWQLRHMRGGFRQLPMDHQIINKLKGRLREDKYDGNFMLEVDGNWVIQGWKGRILYASSCWVPT